MKASVLTKYGSPDFFELREVEKPLPKDNEVLVKVHAASINSWDDEILRGTPFVNRLMVGIFKPTKIQILGCDIAGRVEAVGKNVTLLEPGDEVFGDLSRGGWGGFAEYVCAPENAVILKPTNMTFEQASAVPQAGLLALQGLRKGNILPEENQAGEINSGRKVLINGASGGVGSFAVPLVKLYGAEVTGVCSTGKMEFVRSLGADLVIDYTQENFTKNGQHYDLILDVKGFHSIFDYKRALTPRGIYVMVGGTTALVNQLIFLRPWISMTDNKKMSLLLHKPNKGLGFMKELLEAGKIVPVIDRCYPLNEVAEAFRYFGEGQARGKAKGKIVITLEHRN